MKMMDRVLNKITGRNMETVPVTLEQMLELLKKHFISQASTDAAYTEIMKTVKGHWGLVYKLESKDGRYELRCDAHRNSFTCHNLIWIHDRTEDKFYEYSAWSFRKLKKAAGEAIANAKAGM